LLKKDKTQEGIEMKIGAARVVMSHMAHHRGQAEVYLRLKGITPPEYQW
jgi:uncharacterized damage-inducible protein DinB